MTTSVDTNRWMVVMRCDHKGCRAKVETKINRGMQNVSDALDRGAIVARDSGWFVAGGVELCRAHR
jgi:hypothetical protein